MTDDVILLDGVKYFRYSPEREEDFEELVVKNAREIFGEDAIYLDIKKKIKSECGKGTIPDGYLLDLREESFSIIEVELSKHPIHSHISEQLNGFRNAFKSWDSRYKLASIIRDYIENEPVLLKKAKGKWGEQNLKEYIFENILTPQAAEENTKLIVVIENLTEEAKEAIGVFKPRWVEVAVYVRENAETVKAIRFEGCFPKPVYKREKAGKGLSEYQKFAQEKKLEGYSFEEIGKMWREKRENKMGVEWTKEEFKSYLSSLSDAAKLLFWLLALSEKPVKKSEFETQLKDKLRFSIWKHTVVGVLVGVRKKINKKYPGKAYPIEFVDRSANWIATIKEERYRNWIKETLNDFAKGIGF